MWRSPNHHTREGTVVEHHRSANTLGTLLQPYRCMRQMSAATKTVPATVPALAASGLTSVSPNSAISVGNQRPRNRLSQLIERLRTENVGAVLARGAATSFLVGACGTLISFVAQIILARSIHADQYGEYAYVLSIMNMAVLIGKLEFDPCSVRFVGAYHGTNNWSMLRGFLRRSHQIVFVASLTVSAIGGLIIWIKWHSLSTSLARAALAGLLLQPIMALLSLQLGCLQGLKRIVLAQSPSVVVRPLLFAIFIFAIVRIGGIGIGAPRAVLLQVVAAAIALALSAIFLQRAKPKALSTIHPAFETRLWVRTSLGLMMIASANVVLGTQMDVFVVGTFLRPREAGIYGAASQLASLISFSVTAIIFIAVPMIAEMHAKHERNGLQRLVSLATRWALLVSAPAAALLLVLGPFILRWYGPEFARGYAPLAVLSVGALLTVPIGALAGFLLTMTGHERQAGVIVCGTALLNLLLTIVLTPAIGIAGTALATVTAGLIRAGVFAVYIRRYLAVSVAPFPWARASSR